MFGKYIYILFLLLFPIYVAAQENSTKKERNYIREGNEMFAEKRYADAEKAYQKALQENEFSQLAKFNLATTYLRQVNINDTTKNGLLSQAKDLLNDVASSAGNSLSSKAYYDLGNIFYNQKNYAASIEYYKNALRKNPDDYNARENLRLAQKQLKNQQGGGGGNDNKNDKQNEKQNQEQNKEKNNKGQDQNKPDQNNKQAKQPPQNSMSKENAEQILQTMQNEEKNTQDKVNKAKMQQMKGGRRTNKQW